MKKYIIIVIALVTNLTACVNFEESPTSVQQPTSSFVERLDDGRIRVSADFGAKSMSSAETRSAVPPSDENVYDGWCFIFGVDATLFDVRIEHGKKVLYDKGTNNIATADGYGPDSPLLQKTKVVGNTDGRFYMTFTETTDIVFMRFIVNMSDRENAICETVVTQADIDAGEGSANQLATFGQFIEQSVGLDGLFEMEYNGVKEIDSNGIPTGKFTTENSTQPDCAKVRSRMPLSSHGYVLIDGISTQTVAQIFKETVYLIRTYSKIEVFSAGRDGDGNSFDSEFEIEDVTLLRGANEARFRSTILSSTGGIVETYDIPTNLGGRVKYMPVGVVTSRQSSPIYLYPNTGGDYADSEGVVNSDRNPTYIVIKGKAKGFADYGYYKVAIKAQYPLQGDDSIGEDKADRDFWSPLTYDIWRNTRFSVNLIGVNKPGYPTFDDAADVNSPANNISYSITIDGEDNRNEFLVSKGTYYVELKTSYIYAKGYAGEAIEGDVNLSLNPSSGNTHPNVYIYGEGENIAITNLKVGGVDVDNKQILNGVLTNVVASSNLTQDITVSFKATASGSIAIRCGDMLKYIPIVYDNELVEIEGGKLSIDDGQGNTWSDFAYSDFSYLTDNKLSLNSDGTINRNEHYENIGFEARIFPESSVGFMQLYLKQASDFIMWNNTNSAEAEDIEVVYNSMGQTVNYSGNAVLPTDGVFEYEIKGDKESVTLDLRDGTGDLFNSFGQVGQIAVGEPFSFKIKDIGTNDGNPALESDVTFDLKNSAGETKQYNIKLTQYAAPSADESFVPEVDANGDSYITPKPTDTDKKYVNIYTTWTGSPGFYKYPIRDYGATLETVMVYNCFYRESSDGIFTDAQGLEWGWKWEVVPDDIANEEINGLSAAEQLKRVEATINVGHDNTDVESEEDDTYGFFGTHSFPITVKQYGSNKNYYHEHFPLASAYFVLYVRNKVGERCETRILIQCKSEE